MLWGGFVGGSYKLHKPGRKMGQPGHTPGMEKAMGGLTEGLPSLGEVLEPTTGPVR